MKPHLLGAVTRDAIGPLLDACSVDAGAEVAILVLPAEEAWSAVADARQSHPGAELVVLGAPDDAAGAAAALRAGACEWLALPADREELARAVSRAAAKSRRARERGRLLDEDRAFFERQLLFRRMVSLLASPSDEGVLRVLAEASGAPAAVLWRGDARGLLVRRAALGDSNLPDALDPLRLPEAVAGTAYLPLLVGGTLVAMAWLQGAAPAPWLIDLAAIALHRQAELAEARREPLRDPDTGALGHGFLAEVGDRELRRARRESRPLSLVSLRIADPRALPALAGAVSRIVREVDLLARIGEAELCVLLADTDGEGASIFCRRLRAGIEADKLLRDPAARGPLLQGVASFPADGSDFAGLLAKSRQRLDESLGSAVVALGLESLDFWPSVERLLGTGFPVDAADGSATVRELLREQRRSGGLLAVSCSPEDRPEDWPAGGGRLVALGATRPSTDPAAAEACERLARHQVALWLGADGAVSFVRRDDGIAHLGGDRLLVEHLARRLAERYGLRF